MSQRARSPESRGDSPWTALLARPPAERSGTRIHLVGIGGSGLSAIAFFLLEQGYSVTGSDRRPSNTTDELARRGARVFRGHKPGHVAGADIVLASSAVPPDNPEIIAAEAAGVALVKRADFLGPLMEGQHGIGVAGAHGKTTTASMIAIILLRAGLDPSLILGGRLAVGQAEGLAGSSTISARAGQGPFVIEADEYDSMFLGLRLEVAVVTNVEWDHVDCYPTPAAFTAAFRSFVGRLPADGCLIVCGDDPGALSLRDAVQEGVRVQTYGLGDGADWQARELSTNAAGGFDAAIWFQQRQVAQLSLQVPGRHNVRNALAALAVAQWHGIRPQQAVLMLRDFRGVGRRFELIGEAAGVTVIDDYAHHPTEIAATLSAARLRYPTRRIWAVFQPHTYSRTRALLDEFAHSFDDADQVLLLDIYPAREKANLGMHSRLLVDAIRCPGAIYVGAIDAAVSHLQEHVQAEDIVITLSAGDGNRVGQSLLAALRQHEEAA